MGWGGAGTREFIRMLELWAEHSRADLARAVERGLRGNALIRDALAQFLIPQEDWCGTTFRRDGREHLRQGQVANTEVAAYAALMAGGGAP